MSSLSAKKRVEVEAILVAHLADADFRIRRGIVQALGRVGTNRGISALLEMLNDRNTSVVQAAYSSLGRLTGKRLPPIRIGG